MQPEEHVWQFPTFWICLLALAIFCIDFLLPVPNPGFPDSFMPTNLSQLYPFERDMLRQIAVYDDVSYYTFNSTDEQIVGYYQAKASSLHLEGVLKKFGLSRSIFQDYGEQRHGRTFGYRYGWATRYSMTFRLRPLGKGIVQVVHSEMPLEAVLLFLFAMGFAVVMIAFFFDILLRAPASFANDLIRSWSNPLPVFLVLFLAAMIALMLSVLTWYPMTLSSMHLKNVTIGAWPIQLGTVEIDQWGSLSERDYYYHFNWKAMAVLSAALALAGTIANSITKKK